jgi:hypothetical protein
MFSLLARAVPQSKVLTRTVQYSVRFQSTAAAQPKRVPRVLPSFSLEGKVSLNEAETFSECSRSN